MPEVSLRSTIGREVICLSELPALSDRHLLLSHDWSARKTPAGELGRDSRRAWLHAAELQFSGSPSGIPGSLELRCSDFRFRELPSTNARWPSASTFHLRFSVTPLFQLCDALRLPTFAAGGMRLLKRLTLIVRDGPHRAGLLSSVSDQ